jgi:hypothetical protein
MSQMLSHTFIFVTCTSSILPVTFITQNIFVCHRGAYNDGQIHCIEENTRNVFVVREMDQEFLRKLFIYS